MNVSLLTSPRVEAEQFLGLWIYSVQPRLQASSLLRRPTGSLRRKERHEGPTVAVKKYSLDSATLLWFSIISTHRIWSRLRDESLSMSVMAC